MKVDRDQLKGRAFLEELLKFETEMQEKTAELSYWRDGNSLYSGTSFGEEIEHREQDLRNLIDSMTEKKLKATRLIDKMTDPVGRAVLRRRYILCDTWACIADGCGGMSERNAHYIHDHALVEFEKIFLGE